MNRPAARNAAGPSNDVSSVAGLQHHTRGYVRFFLVLVMFCSAHFGCTTVPFGVRADDDGRDGDGAKFFLVDDCLLIATATATIVVLVFSPIDEWVRVRGGQRFDAASRYP